MPFCTHDADRRRGKPGNNKSKPQYRSLNLLASVAIRVWSMDAEDVCAVATLAESIITRRSLIDIFSGGQFWAAVVLNVESDGFTFRFINSDETGFVRRADFLKKWRFSIKSSRDAVVVGNLMMMLAEQKNI